MLYLPCLCIKALFCPLFVLSWLHSLLILPFKYIKTLLCLLYAFIWLFSSFNCRLYTFLSLLCLYLAKFSVQFAFLMHQTSYVSLYVFSWLCYLLSSSFCATKLFSPSHITLVGHVLC